MNNVIGIIVSYLYVGIIIYVSKFFEKYGEEASRKFIHIALVGWWPIAMTLFTNTICALIVPISFVIINYLSYKKNLIKTMERKKQEGLGTVYFAIALCFMVIYTFEIVKIKEIGLCAMCIMCLGDGFASIIGKKIKSYEYKIGDSKKTIAGSITMLVISFIIITSFLVYFRIELWFIKAIIFSIVLTIIEAISIKGTDNITVPALTCILLTII